MNKILKISWILIALFGYQSGISQTVDSLYEIGSWYGFRNAAISFTFDDGTPKQFTTAVPLFNEFNYHLTLYIVTRSVSMGLPDWGTLQDAASHGHEIGAHTLTHTTFAGMSDSVQTSELKDCKEDIESHITGQKCVTMAYPFCVTGNKSLCAQYYIGARICSGVIERQTPRDFMAISSIVCGTEGSVKTSDNFISRANAALQSKGWCIYLLHGVDNDGGWSPVTSEVLRETLEYFKENRKDYWVDTFSNVTRYIIERNVASVTELSIQDSSITVQVSDTLDNEIFNYPISIRRLLPQSWSSVTATQNGLPVYAEIAEVDENRYIQFDAVPDNGEVVISRGRATHIQSHKRRPVDEYSLRQNYPNPFNPTTTIEYTLPSAEFVSIKLYNVRGELIRTLVSQKQSAGKYSVVLSGMDLASGIYLYNIQAGSFDETKQLVLIK